MAIRWEKLTVKAQEGVQRGNDLASEHGNPELLPLHLLAALLEDKEGIILPVLEKIAQRISEMPHLRPSDDDSSGPLRGTVHDRGGLARDARQEKGSDFRRQCEGGAG